MPHLSPLSLAMPFAILSGLMFPASVLASADPIEHIEVQGRPQENFSLAYPTTTKPQVDISQLLDELPGAAVNSNGPLTGIAQYRGLFGDRVNTQINGVTLAGAGPNAMDSPLSYASLISTETVNLTRGIAPVSAGIDTLGGNIEIIESKASFDEISGKLAGQYQANGDSVNLGGKVNLGDKRHAALLYVDKLDGHSNITTGGDLTITPTEYDKLMLGGQYRYNLSQQGSDDEAIALGYQFVETQDAGTPALPMDIDFIRTHRVKLAGDHSLGLWALNWHLAFSNAKHGMDNYSLRSKADSSSARYNHADSNSLDSALSLTQGAWVLGLNARSSGHDSVITDPTNASFKVDNFHHVKDETYSLFAEWQADVANWQWQLGARVKHYRSDADSVSHSGAGMMPAIKALVDNFNQAKRAQNQTGVDVSINGQYQFNEQLTGILGLARKQDSASYQQRYLWVPMQSTGGLADGRTYVGQLDLKLETAYQAELGFDYQDESLTLSPRAFINRIDNYIQGTVATDPYVIMAAAMMGDDHPLQFTNVDALLYGMDLSAAYRLSPNWQLDLLTSYVRGERRDIEDDLYRIAPLTTRLGINFNYGSWQVRAEAVAKAAQNKIAATQLEQTSAGYALMNISAGYEADSWSLKAGVNNLFDLDYSDHLGAYNRVSGSEIPLNARMPGTGINGWLMGSYHF